VGKEPRNEVDVFCHIEVIELKGPKLLWFIIWVKQKMENPRWEDTFTNYDKW